MSRPKFETEYLNQYECPECGAFWEDIWDCGCDDTCGVCGCKNISPIESVLLEKGE
jgi:hypothetical protein